MFYNQTDEPVKLNLDYLNIRCYHNEGPDHFTVPANWHYGISVEDSNALNDGCTDHPKNLSWFVNGAGNIKIVHEVSIVWQSYGQVISEVPGVRHVEFMCRNGTRSGDGHCSLNFKEDGYMSAIRFCNGESARCSDAPKKPFDFGGHWAGEFRISNHDHSSHYCHFSVTADIAPQNNTLRWTSVLKKYNLFHCPINQDVTRSINRISQKVMDTSIIFSQGKDDRIVRLTPETPDNQVISGQGVFGEGAGQQESNNFNSSGGTKFDYWERLERK